MVYGAADTSPGTGRLGLDKRSAKVPQPFTHRELSGTPYTSGHKHWVSSVTYLFKVTIYS